MNLEIIFNEMPVLESERLVLQIIEDSHLQDLFDIYNNDNVFEYCGIIPKHNLQTVHKMIGHFERDFNKRSRVKWGIFQKEQSNQLVGIIEVMDLDTKVNKLTMGYFLAEKFWGNGIATESVRRLVEFLFKEVGVNRIEAEVMPANLASKNVLIKNGFFKEGLLRQATFWSGKGVVDLEIYAILMEDYKRISSQ